MVGSSAEDLSVTIKKGEIVAHPTDDPDILAARRQAQQRRVADELHWVATKDLVVTD